MRERARVQDDEVDAVFRGLLDAINEVVLGMFLEGVAIILIVLPVVFVVVRQLGIDMTHFAVVMVINIELALLSPPSGSTSS